MSWISRNKIDDALRSHFGSKLKDVAVFSTKVPEYRFVDIFQEVERACDAGDLLQTIDSQHFESLTDILHGPRIAHQSRELKKSQREPFAIGPDEERYLPTDQFWILRLPETGTLCAVRLRTDTFSRDAMLEVAIPAPSDGQSLIDRLIAQSTVRSIYKNAVLNVRFEAGKRDEYGEIEKAEQLHVLFSKLSPVTDEEMVIGPKTLRLIERNVIDLSTRRDILREHGVPTKRGVLFYGPPGTGKTFACRYICHRLEETTRIFLTGSALHSVNAAFTVARLYQPSVIFIEDADLIFTSRDINLYSSTLGELMDQLDGLRENEDVSVVMTTNAIERMEAALKDRPGRISQCIFLGAPERDIRKTFIQKQLEDFDLSEVDLDELVGISKGATQAFIREWLFRAIQIASEDMQNKSEALTVRTQHFLDAMEEMKLGISEASARIVGFSVPTQK